MEIATVTMLLLDKKQVLLRHLFSLHDLPMRVSGNLLLVPYICVIICMQCFCENLVIRWKRERELEREHERKYFTDATITNCGLKIAQNDPVNEYQMVICLI